MSTLMQANTQWSTRPAEERFASLLDMQAASIAHRQHSRAAVVSSRKVRALPTPDNRGLLIAGPTGAEYAPTNWSFGQLSALVGAPAGYLRSLPAPVAADCINYGLQVERDAMDVGVLLDVTGEPQLRAATGPRYGRVWNHQVIDALVDHFGDGITGQWHVPGEFGQRVVIDKGNTTLFAGDRDMFVFLCDEENRITLPNRRNGESGTLARGFFVFNSEVGAGVLGVKTFLFDYVCCNRIVWGAHELEEIRIRHTASAPDRFIEEVTPALLNYSRSSSISTQATLVQAQQSKLDKVDEFLAKRFGPRVGERINAAHVADEGRPIETVWDVVTGATAYARSIQWQADRVAMEEQAGSLLDELVPA
jgi:Domain of unknown function (DUF932)